ncbi:IS3 family transposase [Peribacillus simplex]|uniref:IS3 family transposase n=1 Tax=Peribacillus simplex TaxID=1478 RepID=UPI00159584C0|nr:IS3 family transposase [Peribacillus simplex]
MATVRFTLEEKEQVYELINKVFEGKKKKAGALTIKMILENDFFVTMYHKKIRRLMNKFNLKARIGQANPYKKMAKATHEHKVVPNLLNRKFNQGEPRKTFLKDITYVYYGSGMPAYLSCVKKCCYTGNRCLSLIQKPLVYRTLEKLADSLDELLHPVAMIHSDQGVHFTHPP